MRVLLRASNSLHEWSDLEGGIVSTLVRVESCRTLDRLLHDAELTEEEYFAKVAELDDVLSRLTVVGITETILRRASDRLPVRLATLDALHLATAVEFAATVDQGDPPIHFATHDTAQAAAARAAGFEVLGA